MKKMTLKFDTKSYDIIIENNLIDKLDEYVYSVYKNQQVFIITDYNVYDLYINKVIEVLSRKYRVKVINVPPGENSKNIKTYSEVCKSLLNAKIRRDHLIISLGGGVIGDLGGFVASTILRGVHFINIPTTLLAQMDSSIGGKTGIDFNNQKNVIGTFSQPDLVLIDPQFLKTLPKKEFINGSFELIKHAIIGNAKLFEMLKKEVDINEDIIYESLLVKKALVEKDQFDTGERMKLNFGHTFGHVLELKYSLGHGVSVGHGMLMALRLGIDLKLTDEKIYQDVLELLIKYQLDTNEYDYKKYLLSIVNDKKNINGIINFILVNKIGESFIYCISEKNINNLLNK